MSARSRTTGLSAEVVRCAAAQDRGDRRRGLAEGDFVRQAVEGFENFLLGAREVQADLRFLVQLVAQAG